MPPQTARKAAIVKGCRLQLIQELSPIQSRFSCFSNFKIFNGYFFSEIPHKITLPMHL
jgi:hypothetical protein